MTIAARTTPPSERPRRRKSAGCHHVDMALLFDCKLGAVPRHSVAIGNEPRLAVARFGEEPP